MRINRNSLIAFLLVFIISITLQIGDLYAAPESLTIPPNFTRVTENGSLALYADKKSGEFVVFDSKTGGQWWSNPQGRENDKVAKGMQKMDLNSQLLIKYADTEERTESLVNTFTGSVTKGATSYSAINQGFRIEYSIPQKKSKIAMEISLKDGYLEATIPMDGIEEKGKEVIYSISLLPFFGAGSSRTEGYMLVPDGSGALIRYNNNKQTLDEYKQSLYGNDSAYDMYSRGSVEQDARMPVFGAQNGSCGFLAVITGGDAHGTINARVSGAKSTYNTVFCDFSLRTNDMYVLGDDHWIKIYEKNKPRFENITIRYYLLSGNEYDYNAMAMKYRSYLINEKGMKEKTSTSDIPFYLELYGAVLKKANFLGIPIVTTQELTDYKSALNLLKEMKVNGVGNVILKYTNANKDNVEGTYLSHYNPESKLGSQKQLNELINYCSKNNIVFAPNADLLYFKKDFLGISVFFNAIRTLSGPVAMQYYYKLSIDRTDFNKDERYLITPSILSSKAAGFVNSFTKSGFSSISLDTLGKMLYSDFYKNRSDRQESLVNMQKTAESIANKTKNILLSDANAYMLPFARYVEDSPQCSSKFDITDEDIPFYQLALSGLVSYSTPAVNLDSIPRKTFLAAVENGSALKYTWITGDTSKLLNTDYMNLYGMDSKAWFDSAVQNYRNINEVYKKTGGMNIIHHRIIASGVRETTYTNGAKVIVNYNNVSFTVDGKYTVGPDSFIII